MNGHDVKTLAGCSALLLTLTGSVLLRPFLIMLVLGGLHAEVSDKVPALGFLAVVLINLAIGLVVAPFRRSKS